MTEYAKLTKEQLEALKKVEKELNVVLIAIEKAKDESEKLKK
ncbi:MAG TPA: hypothetical protein VK190_11330 [Pseudoneobacillus sp.]|nr:hypothetical protein [Pseudoneobacillus sp.]